MTIVHVITIDREGEHFLRLHAKLEAMPRLEPVIYDGNMHATTEESIRQLPALEARPRVARHRMAILKTYRNLLATIIGPDHVLVLQDDVDYHAAELARWLAKPAPRNTVLDLYAQPHHRHCCPPAMSLDGPAAQWLRRYLLRPRGNTCSAFRAVREPGPDIFWTTREITI